MAFPLKDQRSKALKFLDKQNTPSLVIDRSKASYAEIFKQELCEIIIGFKYEHRLKSKELAKLAQIPETRINEILHYKVAKMSSDKLLEIIEKFAKVDKSLKKFFVKKYLESDKKAA